MATSFPSYLDPNQDFCHFKIFNWLSSSSPMPDTGNLLPYKILLIRPSSIGDVLLATPIIRALKFKFPNSEIAVCTQHPEIFHHNYDVRGCFNVKEYKKGFTHYKPDRTYWLSYEFSPSKHIVESYADIVGVKPSQYRPIWHVTESESHEARKKLDYKGIRSKFIATHMECTWQSRRWFNWKNLIANIRSNPRYEDFDIVNFAINPCEIEGVKEIIKYDLRTVAAMLSLSKALICIDSGLMHIGTALHIPVISIFGITDPNKRLPQNIEGKALYHKEHPNFGMHHRRQIPAETDMKITNNPIDLVSSEEVLTELGRWVNR